jgi:hypothetical protein
MSLARVHNFAISLDGFGTGEGQTQEAPFGHAGQRLHEWMLATRFWNEMVGNPDGSCGIDDAFAQRFAPGIGARKNVFSGHSILRVVPSSRDTTGRVA